MYICVYYGLCMYCSNSPFFTGVSESLSGGGARSARDLFGDMSSKSSVLSSSLSASFSAVAVAVGGGGGGGGGGGPIAAGSMNTSIVGSVGFCKYKHKTTIKTFIITFLTLLNQEKATPPQLWHKPSTYVT